MFQTFGAVNCLHEDLHLLDVLQHLYLGEYGQMSDVRALRDWELAAELYAKLRQISVVGPRYATSLPQNTDSRLSRRKPDAPV
jgi:hypothetical protein